MLISLRRMLLALLLPIILLTSFAQSQNSFTPGRAWLDETGKPIQSHSGGLLFEKGVYYWYGMDYRGPRIPPNTLPKQSFAWFLNLGVTVYSSRDLSHWKPESNQLADVTYGPGGLLQAANLLVRPKVVKNDSTGKYILMAGLISPDFETLNDVAYAEADRPEGPFRLWASWAGAANPTLPDFGRDPGAEGTGLLGAAWKQASNDAPERIRAFDTTLYKDDDGNAYLITAHSRILAYKLSADYTCATHVEIMQGAEGEAPALFKDRGTYYLLASRLTGWYPNANTYFTSTSIHGPWTPRGTFARGPVSRRPSTGRRRLYCR